jgi:hypothetical protein
LAKACARLAQDQLKTGSRQLSGSSKAVGATTRRRLPQCSRFPGTGSAEPKNFEAARIYRPRAGHGGVPKAPLRLRPHLGQMASIRVDRGDNSATREQQQ